VILSHKQRVKKLIDQGFRPIVGIHTTPAWARVSQLPNDACMPPTDNDTIKDFTKRLVTDFKSSSIGGFSVPVTYWQIWNEPDSTNHAGGGIGCFGDPSKLSFGGQDYGKMLIVAAQGIKEADPNAKVVMGGLVLDCMTCASASFLDGILQVGAGAWFDFVDYHAYAWWSGTANDWDVTNSASPWYSSGGDLIGKAKFIRTKLSNYGLSKPVFLGETGLICAKPDPQHPGAFLPCDGPPTQFLQDQANHVIRVYTRALVNGLSAANWYTLGKGDFLNTDLLNADLTNRLGYTAIQNLTGKLTGAVYANNFSSSPYESYRFCLGSSEYQITWTNNSATARLPIPPNTTVFTKLGTVSAATTVSFEPLILKRMLAYACNVNRPGNTEVIDAAVMRPVYNTSGTQTGMRQMFFAGTTLWQRDSLDAAGTSWPASWTSSSYAASWGSDANHPPTDKIDAVVIRPLYNASGTQTGMRQIFYSGSAYWSRDSLNAIGTSWPASWTSNTYTAAWGSTANHPPTDKIDAAVMRPLYNASGTQTGMRQMFFAGTTFWQRDSLDAIGTSWPTSWSSSSYTAAWSSDTNHPPLDKIDTVVIRPLYNGSLTRIGMRQIFFSGEAFWQRDSLNAAGTSWPIQWSAMTYAAAWGADANHPPTYSP
jgi:hypothetical protein